MEPLEHAGGSDVMGMLMPSAGSVKMLFDATTGKFSRTYREFGRWCGLAVGLYGWSLGWPGQKAEGGDGRAKAVDCVNFDGAGAWN